MWRIKVVNGAAVSHDQVPDGTEFLTAPVGDKPYYIPAIVVNGPGAYRSTSPVYDTQAGTIDYPRLSQDAIAALDVPAKTPIQLIDARRTAAKKATLAETINHVADPDARDALKEILTILEK